MSIPPGRAPGSSGRQQRPSQPPPAMATMRAWARRHPLWAAVIGIGAVIVIIAGVATGNPSVNTSNTSANTSDTAASPAAAAPTPSASASAAAPAPLACHAQSSSMRPRDHTTVKVRVQTAAHAKVTVTGPLTLASGQNAAGRASAAGTRTFRFRVGDATPGSRLVITVRVSHGGSKATCRASLRPRPAPVTAVAAPSSAPAQPASAPSCYPLSNEGTCYEPGEFCRESDQGMTGVAGDGEKIICEDNDGLRWEPA
jgi:hypothetical protein